MVSLKEWQKRQYICYKCPVANLQGQNLTRSFSQRLKGPAYKTKTRKWL